LDLEKLAAGRLRFAFEAADLAARVHEALQANDDYSRLHQVHRQARILVEVAVLARRGGFGVTVADHDSGTAEEFRARMFRRFAQADNSDPRDKSGTGLGLVITKTIVDRHVGRIEDDSQAGTGTALHVDLPALGETGAARGT
jgi:signal transduction histidine kinase